MRNNQELLMEKARSNKTIGSVLETLNADQRVAVLYLLKVAMNQNSTSENGSQNKDVNNT